jgi:hypothetical protein
MTEDRELARRVCALTAAGVAVVAAGGWVVGGASQAAGAVVGGAITVGNFLWLRWTADLALRHPATAAPLRRALWMAASAARFGVVAVALGLAAGTGGLGLVGLLIALTALPITLVAEGLRAA